MQEEFDKTVNRSKPHHIINVYFENLFKTSYEPFESPIEFHYEAFNLDGDVKLNYDFKKLSNEILLLHIDSDLKYINNRFKIEVTAFLPYMKSITKPNKYTPICTETIAISYNSVQPNIISGVSSL